MHVHVIQPDASTTHPPLPHRLQHRSTATNGQVYKVLEPVLVEKNKAEAKLQALPADCGMAWTIIRPGGLKSEPGTGNAAATGA